MAKNIQKFGKFKIEWISTPKIGPCGHGVAFYYRSSDDRGEFDHEEPPPIGFIEGYEWLHKKGGRIKVYILAPDSGGWHEFLCDSGKVLNDLKESVCLGLQGKIKDCQYAKDRFFVVWNA
jgi:hypothetical protein